MIDVLMEENRILRAGLELILAYPNSDAYKSAQSHPVTATATAKKSILIALHTLEAADKVAHETAVGSE